MARVLLGAASCDSSSAMVAALVPGGSWSVLYRVTVASAVATGGQLLTCKALLPTLKLQIAI